MVEVVIDFWRQMDIVSTDDLNRAPVTVIGAGGIGSPTVMALAKMGISRFTIYDHDTIEEHNLPNQFYRLSDIGRNKAEALAEIVCSYSDATVEVKPERFENQRLSGIVISAVDSMAVRSAIWNRVRYNPSVPFYVEARMAGLWGVIHSVNPVMPDIVRWYETTLYSDEAAVDDPCTARAIIFNVFMIASIIGSQVKRFAKGEDTPRELTFDFASYLFLT